jgi:prepilin-type N-terminal cleavage/methylation domain-containing protein
MINAGRRGFTMVEMMFVVAIVSGLAVVTVPNVLRTRITANDQAIRKELRTFSSAMESFRSTQNPFAYPTLATQLTGANPPYLDSNWSTASASAGPTKNGHDIRFVAAANEYNLVANVRSGESDTNFCVDSSGVIRSQPAASPYAPGTSPCTGTPATG